MREGRCLPYGSGIVYWPLGEVMRAECRIVDGDAADVAWTKLAGRIGALLADVPGDPGAEPAERKAALIGRLLGIELAARGEPRSRRVDPERARESFFSAVRSVIEAMARTARSCWSSRTSTGPTTACST